MGARLLARSVKGAEKLKYLKSADVNIGAGEKGLHTTEVFQKPSNRLRTGTRVIRHTSSDPLGHGATTWRNTQPAQLTPLGHKVLFRGGVTTAVVGYGGLIHHENKQRRAVTKSMSTVSVWGIDHGEEIAKDASDNRHFKALVYNKDLLFNPDAKANRKIGRRVALKEEGKGLGIGAGVGAVGGTAIMRGSRGRGAALGAGLGGLYGAAGGAVRSAYKTQRAPGYKAQ